MDDHIQHSVLMQVFRGLESFGEFLLDCLLDHPWSGKPDQGLRFRNMDVSQHRIGRCHTTRGRICKDDNIGKSIVFQLFDGDGCSRHLHQAHDPFLHSCSTCSCEDHQGQPVPDTLLTCSDDRIANIHSHRSTHESEVLGSNNHAGLANHSICHQHRLILAGLSTGIANSIRVPFAVTKTEGILVWLVNGNHLVDFIVKKTGQTPPWRDWHVMITFGTDMERPFHGPVTDHDVTALAVRPQFGLIIR